MAITAEDPPQRRRRARAGQDPMQSYPKGNRVLRRPARGTLARVPQHGRAGGGLACIGLGEDGSTYLASNVLDPSTKAQQPAHTDFSPTLWDWDADGVKGTAARMEQLCVHALLVQLYAKHLVAEGEIPPAPGAKGFGGAGKQSTTPAGEVSPPVWLGKDYQLQCQPARGAGITKGSWQRSHWRALSPLVGPVAAPMEWVEPVLVG